MRTELKEIKTWLQGFVTLGSCAFVDGCHENTELAEEILAIIRNREIDIIKENKKLKEENHKLHGRLIDSTLSMYMKDNEKLKEENETLKGIHQTWKDAFGSTQLTHCMDSLPW